MVPRIGFILRAGTKDMFKHLQLEPAPKKTTNNLYSEPAPSKDSLKTYILEPCIYYVFMHQLLLDISYVKLILGAGSEYKFKILIFGASY